MTVIIVLFLAGIALLAADAFAASFVMAIIGGVALLAGCIVTFDDYGAQSAMLAGIISAVLLAATVYVELVIFPKTRFGRALVIHSASDSTSQPPLAANAIVGSEAQAITTLAPSGYVLIDGRRYEAFCQSGHVTKGDTVRVTGLDNFRLIVSKS